MRRHLRKLVVAIALVVALPGSALASQYSNVIWLGTWFVPDAHAWVASCGQAGIVNVAVNYNQSLSKTTDSCAASKVIPAGDLGSSVYGYRDGAYCGHSTVHYSNVATAGWQLWQQMCTNGSGQQFFWTVGRSYIWTNNGGYRFGEVTSPSEGW